MKYLEDDIGNKSSMRLMCIISLLAAIYFGYTAIKFNSDKGVELCAYFLIFAFAPKTAQKYIENNKK